MKRLMSGILAVVMLITMAIGITGCSLVEDYLPEYETEYFRYAVRTNKDGTKEGYLIGFTELGAQQEYLMLPNEIDNIPIVSFGYMRNTGMYGPSPVGELRSEHLKNLFAPFSTDKGIWIVDLSGWGMPNSRFVQWKNLFDFGAHFPFEGEILAYKAVETFFKKGYQNYIQVPSTFYRLANVIYDLNYDGAADDGYYWVDSYDNGVIEFIPPDPLREGYSFGGWYKEAECENKWDFETDKTGEEIFIIKDSKLEDYSNRDITRLYAKWVKN